MPEQPTPPMDNPELEGTHPICPICSCVPIDVALHDQWHISLERLILER